MQLTKHSHKWSEIGKYLGFTDDERSNIGARPALFTSAPNSFLSTMLSEWGQWTPGDSRGSTSHATLEALKAAVDKAGYGVTAQELHL